MGRGAPHLDFVDLGGHGDANRVCLHPASDYGGAKNRTAGRSGIGPRTRLPCGRERAPAAKNVCFRRRRWTGNLTETRQLRAKSRVQWRHRAADCEIRKDRSLGFAHVNAFVWQRRSPASPRPFVADCSERRNSPVLLALPPMGRTNLVRGNECELPLLDHGPPRAGH